MTDAELDSALREALGIARHAGAVLREGQDKGFVVDFKGEVDLVTDYDLRSQRLVVEALTAAFPGHAILAEEDTADSQNEQREALWLVDPLDGTTNYAHRVPFYCVSLALELRGEPVLGVVVAPALGWELTARRGGGARCNGEPIRVSTVGSLDGALLGTGFPYDRRTSDHNNVPQFSAMIRRAQGIRRMGSAALDCAMVARGLLDGYWEFKLNPWDIAAGALLVREAGGRVTGADGGQHRSTRSHLVASNGLIHEEMLATLRSVETPER
jgi:myo-inositol-1(or 4)-monophosphatase